MKEIDWKNRLYVGRNKIKNKEKERKIYKNWDEKEGRWQIYKQKEIYEYK